MSSDRTDPSPARPEEELRDPSLAVFAGGIAHDFNNLLTGILGNANLARLESAPGSPAVPYLDQIEQICLRAAELCKQMLAYAGKGRFAIEPLDLNRLIADMTHLLQVTISGTAALHLRLAPRLPPVCGDTSQVRRVVMNLVLNASEALANAGGQIELATDVVQFDENYARDNPTDAKLAPGEYVVLEVRDNGAGMTEEIKARIFDPFFTTKFTGRGLGLAAVQGIVRGHGGAIAVESEPGRGSTFRVFLPSAREPAETIPPADASNGTWRGEGTVLIADDEEAVRLTAARMMEALGFQVVLAAGGAEAIDRFRAAPDAFRLALVDLTMPQLSGEEVVRELRQVRADLRVLLMSGCPDTEPMSRSADNEPVDFLPKPFQLATLAAKVREALTES
jgi:two-component system cell cycle sensor histidine kinase/response regulator CckA